MIESHEPNHMIRITWTQSHDRIAWSKPHDKNNVNPITWSNHMIQITWSNHMNRIRWTKHESATMECKLTKISATSNPSQRTDLKTKRSLTIKAIKNDDQPLQSNHCRLTTNYTSSHCTTKCYPATPQLPSIATLFNWQIMLHDT